MPVPVANDITAKIATILDAPTLTSPQIADISNVLASVLAEFQAPAPYGTGREIITVTEQRIFSGNGLAELYVPDIVPATYDNDNNPINPITVQYITFPFANQAITVDLPDVVLQTNYRGLGHNALVRRGMYDYIPSGGLHVSSFPIGNQNIFVSATWGMSPIPADIFDSIVCETAARILINTQVGILGLGKTIKSETTELRESTSTATFNVLTSVITTWRAQYQDCIKRYRDKGLWRIKNMSKRMSI